MSTLPADIVLIGFTQIADFQAAWNLGPALRVDGIAGPITLAAATLSAQRYRAGQPDLSAHVSAAEAACGCGGKYRGCRRVVVLRQLLQGFEALRHALGDKPLPILDIYRCESYNAEQDGAAQNSQHRWGAALDFTASLRIDPGAARRLAVFSGLGSGASSGTLQHADVRHLSGHNTTGSTPAAPALWTYAGR